jgi:hypothetical protein
MLPIFFPMPHFGRISSRVCITRLCSEVVFHIPVALRLFNELRSIFALPRITNTARTAASLKRKARVHCWRSEGPWECPLLSCVFVEKRRSAKYRLRRGESVGRLPLVGVEDAAASPGEKNLLRLSAVVACAWQKQVWHINTPKNVL